MPRTINRPYTRENRLEMRRSAYKRRQKREALGVIVGVLLFITLGVLVITFLTVGGIEQAINGVTAHPVNAGDIAWGIVKVLFTGLSLWLSGVIALIVGKVIADA